MADWQRPGSPPTLPFEDFTYSVSELCAEVRETLRAAPARWVAGEVQRVRRSRAGHLYLELVEKGEGDRVIGKLEAVLWRRDVLAMEKRLRDAGQELHDGLEIRCRGEIDFYAPFGRLQLVVREIDTVFLLGRLSRRRHETLEALARAGLLTRNKELGLPTVPLDLALVTSQGSAAYHDFLSSLEESGLGFRVVFIHAAVQGEAAERELSSAISTAGRLDVDCAVLVRGGGSRTDLAAFDSRLVAEAVARSPVPIVTGLGHEIDSSIADRVAHSSMKTPTRAAEFLIQRVQASERAIGELAHRVHQSCRHQLDAARLGVERVEASLRLASFLVQHQRLRLWTLRDLLGRGARARLSLEGRKITSISGRLVIAAPRALGRGEGEVESALHRVAASARTRLHAARLEVEGLVRLCSQISPQRTLARGFSITRDVRGRVVTAKKQVGPGERITTELVDGLLSSRVEE